MAEHWYVLRTKPKKEQFVYWQLVAREETIYFPALRVKPVNPRASKVRPYFPGYLFVRADLDIEGQNAFSWLPGVVGLVQFGGEPAALPDNLVHELQARIAQVDAAAQSRQGDLQPGDRVRITSGPFAGYEAIFDLRLPGKDRVQVLLAFLSRHPQPLRLQATDVTPLRKSRP